jgi:hypothetical protein
VAKASQLLKRRGGREPNHSSARTLAALLGTVPVALAFGIVLAQLLPLPVPQPLLIGNFSVFPVWVALSLAVFLAPSGKRAWLGLGVVSALLGAALVLGQFSGAAVSLPGAP